MNGFNPLGGMDIPRLKQMMGLMRNPHNILSQMANTNPDLASVLQASGGDYRKAFYALAEKKGVNADEVLKELKTFM